MDRRSLLKGSGAVIGLPFLESLVPKNAKAEDKVPPTFAIFLRHPHGTVQSSWWPTQKNQKLTNDTMPADRACSKLLPHADLTSFLWGMSFNYEGSGCHHNIHGVQMFSSTKPIKNSGQGKATASSETMEWQIAKQFHPTVDPLVVYAGSRMSTIINDTCSSRFDGSKVIGENNPYKLYNRIFGMKPKDNATDLLRISVNDFVRDQIKAMEKNTRISVEDKQRLDLHLTSIRDTEKKIAATLPQAKIDKLKQLAGTDNDLKAALKNSLVDIIFLQMDIIALAISSGYVRGVNFQMLDGIGGDQLVLDGKKMAPSHALSHYEVEGQEKDTLQLKRLDMFWAQSIAYLATQLSKDKFDNKPILDYGVIMAATEIQQGKNHFRSDIPHMLLGTCNGRLKSGSFFDFGTHYSNNLLATVGWALGLKNKDSMEPMTDFGNAETKKKGPISMLMNA